MKEIIKNIFGKEENLSISDVENNVIKKCNESTYFECTTLEKIEKMEDKEKEGMLKELVAFLNRPNKEGGVLALGILAKDHIPTKITPVNKKIIDESRLRNWIRDYISSIPRYTAFPEIEIEEVEASDQKDVFFIEIHPVDTEVVYYSRITDYVYIRKGSSSERLTLTEILELIKKKTCPKVYLQFRKSNWKEENGMINGDLDIYFRNLGREPGRYINSLVFFNIPKENSQNINITVQKGRWDDISYLNPNVFKALSIITGYPPNTKLIYPNIITNAGKISLKFKKDIEIAAEVTTNENRGYSEQKFIIWKDGIKEIDSKYFPY